MARLWLSVGVSYIKLKLMVGATEAQERLKGASFF